MLPSSLLLTLLMLLPSISHAQTTSDKRGLTYLTPEHPNDDEALLSSDSSLTWYYSYKSLPDAAVTGLEFVPMLWGDHDNTFVADVTSQLPNVKYVLGFNEPDMSLDVGGTEISPERAAFLWKRDIQPLKGQVKLGAPAVSSAEWGMPWLKSFFDACDGCSFDFIPIHWYGNFEGLASHLGHYHVTFPDQKLWITELGYAHVDLQATEDFFNSTVNYLDNLDYVERYSWFGAFRADVSNVGPNGAMLSADGKLTDIGLWYLGLEGSEAISGAAAVLVKRVILVGMVGLAVGWGMFC
ncbi:glycosyl hydrolase catalytic core-domain-containing protein [Morchella snyderi]|nr:glycosyl hydrolase catalytic core-domain-containing protein [Morchella snyderi]